MVTLIKDIKADEKTAAKEATIRKNFVAREKIISMFSLQQKSESVNSRLKKLGEDLKSTANHKLLSNESKTPSLPSARMIRSKPQFTTSH